MKAKKPTQKERLIKALSKNWLTTYDACHKNLSVTLPKRIGDLRKDGYLIAQEWVVKKGIKPHFKYKIVN